MHRIETTESGLATINQHIDRIQDLAITGIAEPAKANACLRRIRSDLYDLQQTIRKELVINPYGGPGNGPQAA